MAKKIEVPATHADLFDAPHTAVLTTVGADGQPQSTAVWYLVDDDGVLKTSTTTDRQKYRNLTRNPKAALFIFDPANPFRTLEIRATVELAPDPDKALLPKFRRPLQHPGGDARPARRRARHRHPLSRPGCDQWLTHTSIPCAHRLPGSETSPRA